MSADDVSLQIDKKKDNATSKKEDSWKDDDFLSFGDNNDETDQDKNSSTAELATAALTSTPHCPPVTHRKQQQESPNLNESLTAVHELPPWMDHYHETQSQRNNNHSSSRRPYQHSRDRYGYNHIPKLINLHNEIVNFASLMAPTFRIGAAASGDGESEEIGFGDIWQGTVFDPSVWESSDRIAIANK